MKILVLGSTGFIGCAITKKLMTQGHTLVLPVRNVSYASTLFESAMVLNLDESLVTSEDYWLRQLQKIDVIINCLGIFDKKKQQLLHYELPKALYNAAQKSTVKFCLQISALGIEQAEPTLRSD